MPSQILTNLVRSGLLGDIGRQARGLADEVATVGSSLGRDVLGGVNGLLRLAATGDPDAAVERIEQVRNDPNLTYVPRTQEARENFAQAGDLISRAGRKIQNAPGAGAVGDFLYNASAENPALYALAAGALGVADVSKGSGKQIVKQAAEEAVEQAARVSAKKRFRVEKIGEPGSDYGQHGTNANAEKRIDRLVSMSRGKQARDQYQIVDDSPPEPESIGAAVARDGLLRAPKTGPAVINIGHKVGDVVKLTPELIEKTLKKRGVKVKTHTVRESATEPTSVIELNRPLTAIEADDVARELKQDAIAQKVGDAGELFGPRAAEWGPFNPDYFLQPEPPPLFSGKAYRYAEGFEGGAPPGATAADVIKNETKRGVAFNLSPDVKKKLKGLPAESVVWVGRSRKQLMREYGPQDGFGGLIQSADDLSDVSDEVAGGIVLHDGPDGTLILRPEPRAPKFPQYAETYPAAPPPEMKLDKKKGTTYEAKGSSPESREFLAERERVRREMEEDGYEPYFDLSKRKDANLLNHPSDVDTYTQGLPKKPATVEKWRKEVQTDEARARLQAAYDAGVKSGNHDAWYKMGQLEDEFIAELGPEEGPRMFRERFADAMASTTGGATPEANLLMAHYGNFLRARGQRANVKSFDMPPGVGNQYASGNMGLFDRIINLGERLGVGTPKRHNFSRNFQGDASHATIDEQMTDLITPGKKAPEGDSYFAYEELIREMAEKNGVDPRDFQDVVWGGKKNMATGGKYKGRPMIEIVNEAIERTHRLTGMSKRDIVRKGLVRAEIPLYGMAGAGLLAPMLMNRDQQGNL